jgi:hypothetical protein
MKITPLLSIAVVPAISSVTTQPIQHEAKGGKATVKNPSEMRKHFESVAVLNAPSTAFTAGSKASTKSFAQVSSSAITANQYVITRQTKNTGPSAAIVAADILFENCTALIEESKLLEFAQCSLRSSQFTLSNSVGAYHQVAATALKEGFIYKAADSYGKAAVTFYTFESQLDAGLGFSDPYIFNTPGQDVDPADVVPVIPITDESRKTFPIVPGEIIYINPVVLLKAKSIDLFEQIGDYAAIDSLMKDTKIDGVYPKLPQTDLEKISSYPFHSKGEWQNANSTEFEAIEKKLNSGNTIRLKFDLENVETDKAEHPVVTVPDRQDLINFGDTFIELIDFSPTFRHYFYQHINHNDMGDFTIRAIINPSPTNREWGAVDGPETLTLFPYASGSKVTKFSSDKLKTILLHEFSHQVQPYKAPLSLAPTKLLPYRGFSHGREQTAFIGGVINQHNHWLKLATETRGNVTASVKPIITNIDRSDVSEDLMLYQPEWLQSKAKDLFEKSNAAILKHHPEIALHQFANVSNFENILIKMYDADFGRDKQHSRYKAYNAAEVVLQQMLLTIDRADWFAAEESPDNHKTRESMGQFLNLLVQENPGNPPAKQWRTIVEGAFNYLSMDPRVEIPNYNPDLATPGSCPKVDPLPGAGSGKTSKTAPLAILIGVVSAAMVGISVVLAKKAQMRVQPQPQAQQFELVNMSNPARMDMV